MLSRGAFELTRPVLTCHERTCVTPVTNLQDAFGWSVRFRNEAGVYADLDAGGVLIGILSRGAAKALSFPVEPIDPEVRTAGSAMLRAIRWAHGVSVLPVPIW